jgi:hypothetical protein
MGQIRIIDTGYGNINATGSQNSLANIAGYDGTSAVNYFQLNVKNVTMNSGGQFMDKDELHNDEKLSTISPVTHSNPTFTLTCSIPVGDIPTTGFQYSWLWQLTRLERTKSIKLLYITALDIRLKHIIEMIGRRYYDATYTGKTQWLLITNATTPFIPVYVKHVSNIAIGANTDELNFQMIVQIAGEP